MNINIIIFNSYTVMKILATATKEINGFSKPEKNE